jgi:hypothetical protein
VIGLARSGSFLFNFLDEIHALNDLACDKNDTRSAYLTSTSGRKGTELTEDDVSAIKPRCNDCKRSPLIVICICQDTTWVGEKGRTSGDEELGSVGVLSGVGHREETRLGVLQLEVLI